MQIRRNSPKNGFIRYNAVIPTLVLFLLMMFPNRLITDGLRLNEEQELLSQCKEKFNFKQTDEAISLCSKAIILDPTDENAYNLRGWVKVYKNQFPEAVIDFSSAIKINSKNWNSFFKRSYAYYFLGEYEKSLSDINRSIQLNPNHFDSYFLRSMIYESRKNYSEALADINTCLRKDARSDEALIQRGRLYLKFNRPDDALKDFDRVISFINPKNAIAFYYRGLIRASYKQPQITEQACEDFRKAVELGNEGARNAILEYCSYNPDN
ncbi:tetratricopeptide repeat protein [Leptospira inadai]|uniref:Tetratricopeptide repeat protein n=1 Tax=Leptospira inadai serovar Lyme TaxID=293084 RepID=A0ABX4YDF2_9LEPT|nr:tetratricopeptide repeat protein [Leptospira inadai]PNV72263.1 hypothetical protein BES34_019850 [Leptospira inadai serovar Lyme]